MDSSTSTLWAGPFSTEGLSGYFLFVCFIEFPVFDANSVDPDQTPHSAASDLGLHCRCPFYGTLGINGLSRMRAG